jgi:hypothetical protein
MSAAELATYQIVRFKPEIAVSVQNETARMEALVSDDNERVGDFLDSLFCVIEARAGVNLGQAQREVLSEGAAANPPKVSIARGQAELSANVAVLRQHNEAEKDTRTPVLSLPPRWAAHSELKCSADIQSRIDRVSTP